MKTSGIVLAVGAPNVCSDGRKTMCAIVLSQDVGLIRVYPVPADVIFGVWSHVTVEIERHNKDNRAESYRMNSFSVGGKVEDSGHKLEILEACTLQSGTEDPIEYQNRLRKSIALVKLDWGSVVASLSRRVPEISAADEECPWIVTQGQHWQKPYLQWTSRQGSSHKTHLVGREVYEGLRKNQDQPWNIFNNLRINSPDYQTWLLLGNMRDRRNVWVAAHVHRLKKNASSIIPLFSTIRNGKPDGWPYSQQEDSNVSVADGQLTLFTTEDIRIACNRGSMATTI
jgi:hypothetical protein